MDNILKKVFKYLAVLAIALVVFLAAGISLARYFMPSVDQYEQQITNYIEKELQLEVHFGTFEGDWYRFGPALKITDLVLSTHEGRVVTEIDALYVSINLLTSLAERKIVPAYLNVIGLQISLEQNADKRISITNLPATAITANDHHVVVDLLKKYNRITLRRSQIDFKNANGVETPIYLRSLVLSRLGNSHQLDMALNLLNHPTRLEMVTEINGDLAIPEKLAVNGYVKVNDVVLSDNLKTYFYQDYSVNDGVVDLHAWFDWQNNALHRLQAQMNLQQVHLFSKQKNAVLKPFNLDGEFLWQRESQNAWSLSSNDLSLGIDESEPIALDTVFKLTEHNHAYEFVADKILLAPIAEILLWSDQLSQGQHELLTDMQPKGAVEHIKLNWKDEEWELGLLMNNVSVKPVAEMPGVDNISGTLIANTHSAKLNLSSQDMQINYPDVIAEPLLFNHVKGDVTSLYDVENWQVKTDNLVFLNDDLEIETEFTLNGGSGIDTFADVIVYVPELASERLYYYLPIGILSTDLADWFKASMHGGNLEKIVVATKGPVSDMPFFDEGTGNFRLAVDINNMNLQFQPDWPMLEQLNGRLLFAGRHIDIILDTANIFQTKLLGVSGAIELPEEGTSWLTVHGETLTSVAHAVDFINATPLSATLGQSLDAFTFNIPATLTLDLQIPLDNEHEETKLQGVVQASEGDALINELQLQFTQINGVFSFTENNIASTGIHTKFLGNPAILSMTPEIKNNHHLTHWQLNGRANMADVANIVKGSLWDYINGESDYTASFTIDNDSSEEGFDLAIDSNLQGTEINLPAPLGKTRDQSVLVRYTTSIDKPVEVMRLEYANLIDSLARFNHQQGKTTLAGAKILLGGKLKNFEVADGINVTGQLPEFSYDVWESFIDAANEKASSDPNNSVFDNISAQIKHVDITIDKLQAFYFPMTKAQVDLTQVNQRWLVKLNSNELKGKITIPQTKDAGILALNFDYCNWNNVQHVEEKNDLEPHHLIPLSFNCNNFIYNQKSLGAFKFNIETETNGVKFNDISMTRPNDKITANGRWWVENNQQTSKFTGNLTSNAFDKTLALIDVKSTVLDSKANSDFTLSWPSDPFDFDLAKLNGAIDIKLSEGRIVDVNPGFGRILSLLSIQSIERRLRLDFSDVFKKGFSFDDISAHIDIKNGVAHSDNLVLKAPAAEVKMKGNVNLGTKHLDLFANVTTHITSSLPIAATIASGGNPIVGAVGVGVWAVDKIIKSRGSDMLGSSYHVTGTWENPVVNGK